MAFWRMYLTLCLFCALTSCQNQNTSEEKAIRENTSAYEEAFNKKDSAAIGALWAEDGTYVVPESGETIDGRRAIQEKFDTFFKKRPDAKIEVRTSSITFPNKDEAIEIARASIKQGDEVLSETAYKAFYEKLNGKWLISELREVTTGGVPNESEHLKDLGWLIGHWVDQDEDTTVSSSYEWDKYKHFIIQVFTVTAEGSFELEGKQIIGWDPITKKIRSWIFDSDGSFGNGTWTKQGDSWVTETASTLTDGRRASAINIITPLDQNRYSWQSTGRSVGGELMPDIEPVTVVRSKN